MVLILLSPAKTLSWGASLLPSSLSASVATAVLAQLAHPALLPRADPLISIMKRKSQAQIKALMGVSDNLAKLNKDRFDTMHLSADATALDLSTLAHQSAEEQSSFPYRPSALAFDGPAYKGLDSLSWSAEDWASGQSSLCILCGLYGVLRPLDLMQPYRLEMGTKLPVGESKDLYGHWREDVTEHLAGRLEKAEEGDVSEGAGERLVVNLASQEYSKSVDLDVLSDKVKGAKVVHCEFKDDGRVVSVFAKRARGLMSRYIIQNRLKTVEGLKGFDIEGYTFSAEKEDKKGATTLTFNRSKSAKEAAAAAAAAGGGGGGGGAKAKSKKRAAAQPSASAGGSAGKKRKTAAKS